VPYHLNVNGETPILVKAASLPVTEATAGAKVSKRKAKAPTIDPHAVPDDPQRTPIDTLQFRQRARVAGKVYSMRVQPWSGVAALELKIVDDTGALTVVFFGRRHLAGVTAGTRIVVEGVVGEHHGTMAMLNPVYQIVPGATAH
jgi:RecG-like helicase